jgi:PAS domain S-box-containing protein
MIPKLLVRLRQTSIGRYGVALLSVLLALLVMLLLDRWMPMQESPFLLLFAAVMVSGWYGGMGPGIFATAIAVLLVGYLFIPLAFSWNITLVDNAVRLGLFVLVSLMIVSLSAVRRQLVSDLRQERDLISAVVTTAGSLILVLDRAGKVVQFNRTCERTTGYSAAEVIGRQIWELLIPPEERSAVQTIFSRLQAGMLPSNYEGDLLTRIGGRRRIAWSNTVLFDDQGKVRYIIATGIDVTERNQVAQALQEKNHQLQALIQASPLAITVLDRHGVVKLWNPAAERIFGWSEAEAIGRVMPSVPADKRAELAANIGSTFSGNLLNGIETQRQRQDGSTIDISLWTAVFHHGNDEEDSILSIVADVSDRKQAEAALKDSQERLTRFVESNVIGILFGDVEGNIHQANDEFLRLVGYSRAELEAGRVHWIEITPPDYLPLDAERIAEAQERGACTPYEKEYIRKDGSRVPVLVGYTLLGAARQQSVAFILDLTDRKQLEQALQDQAAELAQANRMKDEFLAVLSHELRTPLNSILGWAKLLRTRQFDAETTSRALETIERNARLQTQLVEDILDVSKIIQGKLRLQTRTIDLAPVIQAALEAMGPAAAAKQIDLQFQTRCQPARVLGDLARLQQVFWNLLSNAIKFTPNGGRVSVQLETEMQRAQFLVFRAQNQPTSQIEPTQNSKFKIQNSKFNPQPTYARITVTDTGSGIEPEFLPFVFDRFRQANSTTTRTSGGLGLGLSIVRHLVELQGGTVEAASQGLGQGATFTVRLPLLGGGPPLNGNTVLDQQMCSEPLLPAFTDRTTAPLLTNVRVLIVEDESDTRDFLRLTLEQFGATVNVATTAAEGIRYLAAASLHSSRLPDVLISDIELPHTDGYSFIQQVRALQTQGQAFIPALALTAYTSQEHCDRALTAGFQMYLAKPIDPNILIKAVANLAGWTTPQTCEQSFRS